MGNRRVRRKTAGAFPGYYDLLEVLQNPDDERYAEMREWIGEDFDPQAFSADAVNRQLGRGRARRRSSNSCPLLFKWTLRRWD
ncbi:MAG: hypothetical protein JO300_13115 [Silvibacterium sp.]|nr:hypothetical protein [Silvibacterium sp.]